jgi:DMSO/TMAO reductase YedYZ molybdopterin-dependent catalytic subunit
MKRRLFLASSLAAVGLAGCGGVKNALTNGPFRKVLTTAEGWNYRVIGTHGLAREYPESAITPTRDYTIDSLPTPSDPAYLDILAGGYGAYRLVVDGLVARPQRLSLAELRALGTTTQITRHDCVEGWSVIGKWSGVRLSTILSLARPSERARYVVFHCFDRDDGGTPYYESLDLAQAAHPQTILALDLNGAPVGPDHGGPARVRIATQLGYKSAKWVRRIQVAADLRLYGGKGGYWEDQGYAWYAGI